MDENNKTDKNGILEFIKNNKILLAILFFVVFILFIDDNNLFVRITQKREIRELKTGKRKIFPINDKLKQEIEEFTKGMPEDQPLFYTQKGRRMERSRAYKILNKAARAVGITRRIGTHTLRKTFGYHCYQKYDDVVLLQKIFNHSSPQITLRYIGIEQEDIDAVYREFYL